MLIAICRIILLNMFMVALTKVKYANDYEGHVVPLNCYPAKMIEILNFISETSIGKQYIQSAKL